MSTALGTDPLSTDPHGTGPKGAGPAGIGGSAPDGTGLPVAAGQQGLSPQAGRPRKNRILQLPRSPKIRIGLGLSLLFTILAIIGPWIAPLNPSKSLSTMSGLPQPPPSAHWLGTTQVQQDVLSQLLVGGRSTILVALIAGAIATVLAGVLRVTAGDYGGPVDDLVSVLGQVLLVPPALAV